MYIERGTTRARRKRERLRRGRGSEI